MEKEQNESTALVLDPEMQEILAKAKDKLRDDLVNQIAANLKSHVEWRMADAVAKEVDAFMDKEITPEIRKHLMDKRVEIVHGIQVAIGTLGQEFTKALVSKLASSVSKMDSWKVKKVIEELVS